MDRIRLKTWDWIQVHINSCAQNVSTKYMCESILLLGYIFLKRENRNNSNTQISKFFVYESWHIINEWSTMKIIVEMIMAISSTSTYICSSPKIHFSNGYQTPNRAFTNKSRQMSCRDKFGRGFSILKLFNEILRCLILLYGNKKRYLSIWKYDH